MKYDLIYSQEAHKDLKDFKKSGNKVLLKKIAALIKEIQIHPFKGTGKPEELKHQLAGLWSRRINREHRIIYKVNKNLRKASILSLKGHYW